MDPPFYGTGASATNETSPPVPTTAPHQTTRIASQHVTDGSPQVFDPTTCDPTTHPGTRLDMTEANASTDGTPWPGSPERSATMTFPVSIESPAAARRFVNTTVRGWGFRDLADHAELMVSELVTNVVIHANTAGRITCRALPAGVRIEIEDAAAASPHQPTPDADRTWGRGLAIVATLARRWGTEVRGGGKTVWFELDDDANQLG